MKVLSNALALLWCARFASATTNNKQHHQQFVAEMDRIERANLRKNFMNSVMSKAKPVPGGNVVERTLMNDDDAYFGYGFNISNFSFKYARCQAIEDYNSAAAEENNYDSVMIRRRFAIFRLCPRSNCSSKQQYGCSTGYGEYMVELNDYLTAMQEYNEQKKEAYCKYCEECINGDGADNGGRRKLQEDEQQGEENEMGQEGNEDNNNNQEENDIEGQEQDENDMDNKEEENNMDNNEEENNMDNNEEENNMDNNNNNNGQDQEANGDDAPQDQNNNQNENNMNQGDDDFNANEFDDAVNNAASAAAGDDGSASNASCSECSNYYSECQEEEQNEYNVEVDYENYFECTAFNYQDSYGNDVVLYVGPICSKNKYTIEFGLFYDEFCSEYAGNKYDLNTVTGLDFKSDPLNEYYDSEECISCKENLEAYYNVDEDNQDGDNINQICENLYQYAAKCENNMYQNNQMSYGQKMEKQDTCMFLGNVMKGSYDQDGKIFLDQNSYNKQAGYYTKPESSVTTAQKVWLSIFVIGTVFVLGLLLHVRSSLHRVMKSKAAQSFVPQDDAQFT